MLWFYLLLILRIARRVSLWGFVLLFCRVIYFAKTLDYDERRLCMWFFMVKLNKMDIAMDNLEVRLLVDVFLFDTIWFWCTIDWVNDWLIDWLIVWSDSIFLPSIRKKYQRKCAPESKLPRTRSWGTMRNGVMLSCKCGEVSRRSGRKTPIPTTPRTRLTTNAWAESVIRVSYSRLIS